MTHLHIVGERDENTRNETVSDLKIVTLDNYYRCIDKSIAREFFSKLTALRAYGYGPDYPELFLPYDMVDFVARHHLFCVSQGDELVPIGGIRHVTRARCDRYGLLLPLYKMTLDSKSQDHITSLSALIDDSRKTGKDLLYSSSFTITKEYRSNRELCSQIADLIAGLTYCDYKEFNCGTSIGGAAVRFKTQRIFSKWGYRPIEKDGVELPPIPKKVADQEELVLLISLHETSEYSRQCYDKYEKIINSRLLISDGSLAASVAA